MIKKITKIVKTDINVLVDSSPQNGPLVPREILFIIRAPTEKTDSDRRPGNDQCVSLSFIMMFRLFNITPILIPWLLRRHITNKEVAQLKGHALVEMKLNEPPRRKMTRI